MPPTKSRFEDSRSETSSTKEKTTTQHNNGSTTRKRGNGGASAFQTGGSNLKESMTNPPDGSASGDAATAQANSSGMNWQSEDVALLHSYRSMYKLDAPTAFQSLLHQALLTKPGIGKHSPTMARKKDKRRVSKKELASAVRKNFNNSAINENEVIVDLLYKVRSQDKVFRRKFAPR